MKKQFFVTIVGLFTILASIAVAGQPFMLKDINPWAGYSFPMDLTEVNGVLFFQADDGTNGVELWKSDGTPEGTVMVKDINPGTGSSSPSSMSNINGVLFFSADDGTHGAELWKSDGTEAGTVMVCDINPGTGSSSPSSVSNINGVLFFSADDGKLGRELWKTNGTMLGTVMIKDINPEWGAGSIPLLFTEFNGMTFFRASDGAHGLELWKTDGTEAGTVMVKDIYPGGSSSPGDLTVVNNILFFSAYDAAHCCELWKTDGTEAGTVLVKDIAPGGVPPEDNGLPSDLINMNGVLFFSAFDGTSNGRELWKSDGTEAGTIMVKDINPVGNSNPGRLTNVNGVLFFRAEDDTHGIELWKCDGTPAGTIKMVNDINPGFGDSYPENLTNVNGVLFFTADDGINGEELWKSDGTSEGTLMVGNTSYSGTSYLAYLTNMNNALFFAADDNSTYGIELWMYLLNDDCQSSIDVSVGRTYQGISYGAGAMGVYVTSCGFSDSAEVWYSFQPQTAGQYTISAGSDEFDTTLAVYNACYGQELACNDDYNLTTDSQITMTMVKGKRYYIRVAGYNGQSGNFDLTVTAGACTELVASDLNGDCVVDMQDFITMASDWLVCNKSPATLCPNN
jgi:ELWxxDGT repeat protein